MSRRNWGTHFDDPEVEADYCKDVSVEVYRQTKVLAKFLNLCGAFILVVDQVKSLVLHGHLKALDDAIVMNVIAAVAILNIGLLRSSQATSEYYISACVGSIMGVTIAFNPYRIGRFLPLVMQADDAALLQKCSTDVMEGARDCRAVGSVCAMHAFLHFFVRSRAKVTVFIPICLAVFVFCDRITSFSVTERYVHVPFECRTFLCVMRRSLVRNLLHRAQRSPRLGAATAHGLI
jgi:hypothetical protein